MQQNPASDYSSYRGIQVEANARKFQNIWATPAEMDAVARLIREHVPGACFGLCHGARNGQEVRLLKARLGEGVRVLGTDIGPSANAIPDMVEWDFHDLNPEWTARTDFVYSNSWDHTYDINLMAGNWARTLRPQGIAIIHWTRFHTEIGMNSGPDMFGCGEDEIAAVFVRAGLRELPRVRIPRVCDTDELSVEIRTDLSAPGAEGGVVRAHYVQHDGEVVLIPLMRPAA